MNSNKPSCLLTFEWDCKNETLEIHSNQEGLERLKKLIDSLVAKKDCDHVHLMTDRWGGSELTDDKQGSDNEIINHVKIYKWVGKNG